MGKKPPDSGGGEDNDHNKLWCICRQPENGKFMIQCDECGEWLHGECVGLSSPQGLRMEECAEHYLCPLCDPKLVSLCQMSIRVLQLFEVLA